MSRKLLNKARKRLNAETGTRSNPRGGRLAVALVYPNTYHHAMSNLGFQTVYHLLNSRDDCLCERFFLPDKDDLDEHRRTGTRLFSLESGKPLLDFDLITFSISFENDYLNLPVIFELGRIPWLAKDRGDTFPLILTGGVCAFMNPEPLADVMDLFAVGEAEVILPGLVGALKEEKTEYSVLAKLSGIYVPSLYVVKSNDDGSIAGWDVKGDAPFPVKRLWLEDLDKSVSRSFVQTEETEFGDMALAEVSRGCSRGCRFCAAGFLFLPPRERSLDNLLSQVDTGLCDRKKQGLVSPAVGDYPLLPELQKGILERGGTVSVASLRMDSVAIEDVEALVLSGHKTVSLAPEAGSQKLRDSINKGVTDEQILHAVKLIADGGIPNLKFYFLIGLPDETTEDVEAIVALIESIRSVWLEAGRRKGQLGSLHLSVNPFVPKPFTPFQWVGMATESELKKKIKTIRSGIGKLANVSVSFESPKSSLLQCLLSRGDRRLAEIIPALASGGKLRTVCSEAGIDWSKIIHRHYSEGDPLPWEVLDSGVRREYLWQELLASRNQITTPRCVAGCVRCGVC